MSDSEPSKALTLVTNDGIRDADLLASVEKARGSIAYDSSLRFYQAQQRERDAKAATEADKQQRLAKLPREQRRRAVVREAFENSPPTLTDVRHIHSVLAMCGLPYERQPIENRRHERGQGNMSLVIHAGELMTPTGEWQQQALPFGPKARLILMHTCSEAVRQKSATIDIAETFTAFVREMGFPDNGGRGGALTAFREQLNALAACDMRIGTFNGVTAKTKSFKPIDEFEVWLSANPGQQSLWPSTLTFSQSMFESLQRHALPVNVKAVRAFAGSARKLDLYFWLGYRMYNLREPRLTISWKALAEQFGQGFTRDRAFRAQLVKELAHIREVFPKMPFQLTDNGLSLEQAGTEMLALPKLTRTKKT